jgi:hypothetical protein
MSDTVPPGLNRQDDLERRLARTGECILEGKRLIHEQEMKIYALELRSLDMASAKHRLAQLMESQALYEEQWRAILRALKA